MTRAVDSGAGAALAKEAYQVEFLGMTTLIASSSMRHLFAMAQKIAATDAPVLITGESGTGKELVARALHHYSPRAAKPFVDVNCAAFPEHLIESELFGYERGAFSGADSMKPGLFEAAHGGILFLDEIGEIDPRIQVKLLRVLDGQPFFRLGGTRKVHPDVRILAATNLDMEEAVQTRKFRKDLYHRLDVFHLRVPALRDRPEDVAPLSKFFLEGTGRTLSSRALKVLQEYSWPGNIRELKNVLCKASLFAAGPEIEPEELPPDVFRGEQSFYEDACSLGSLEQQTIFKVLQQTGGHQQRAADLLGISRRTLIRKLKIYRSLAGEGPDFSETFA